MELQAQQAALGQQQEPLIQDVPTQWNSTLEMIKCLNRNKAAIRATLDQQHRKTGYADATRMGQTAETEHSSRALQVRNAHIMCKLKNVIELIKLKLNV